MFQRLAIDRGAILFEPERVDTPAASLFDRDHWRALDALVEQPGGRGSIHFIGQDGRQWALRRYLRGGAAARFARDRYLYLGEERTRSFRELRLLDAMHRRRLPVPAPVAARYQRGLLTYEAQLITERLPAAQSLEAVLAAGRMNDARWQAIGNCLRRFHEAGVQHPDLNIRNIMLGGPDEVWLLDFDRGRLRTPGAWRERVLERLERSLAKDGAADARWREGFRLLRKTHDA